MRLSNFSFQVRVSVKEQQYDIQDLESNRRFQYPFGQLVCRKLNDYYPPKKFTRSIWDEKIIESKKVTKQVNHAIKGIKDVLEKFAGKDALYSLATDRQAYIENYNENELYRLNFSAVDDAVFSIFYYSIEKNEIVTVFGVKSLDELIVLDICNVLSQNISINRCKACDRFFIPVRKTAKYCELHREGGKESRYGASKAKRDATNNNRCALLRKLIYNRLRNKKNLGYNVLNAFSNASAEYKDSVAAGTLDESTYYEWLCEQDKQTRSNKRKPANP